MTSFMFSIMRVSVKSLYTRITEETHGAILFLKLKNALRVFDAVGSDRHDRNIGDVVSNHQVSSPRPVVLDIQADPMLVCRAAIGVQCPFGNPEFPQHASLYLASDFDPVRMIGSLGLSESRLGALTEAQLILPLEHSDHGGVWWEAVLFLFSFTVIYFDPLCSHVPSTLDAFNFSPKVSNFRGLFAPASPDSRHARPTLDTVSCVFLSGSLACSRTVDPTACWNELRARPVNRQTTKKQILDCEVQVSRRTDSIERHASWIRAVHHHRDTSTYSTGHCNHSCPRPR